MNPRYVILAEIEALSFMLRKDWSLSQAKRRSIRRRIERLVRELANDDC